MAANLKFGAVPLYLSESDLASLLTPAEAVDAIEESFRRMAQGQVENVPRRRLRLDGGTLADMAAADLGVRVAGAKVYAAFADAAAFVVCLFDAASPELV